MATNGLASVVRDLCRLATHQEGEARSDGQLLADFAARRDTKAFAAIVRRHGPMVFGVCRRMLKTQDAEDAFQATFLVLVRKAAALGRREILGNWLHGVAFHTALKVRAAAARAARDKTLAATRPAHEASNVDALALLDKELNLLPEHHRAALVLCDLGGKTYKEAALQLGCREGTIASRLARARALLARRLTRRGVALTAAGLTTTAVPSRLAASAVRTADGIATPAVIALADSVVTTLMVGKTKALILGVLCLIVLGVGLGLAVSPDPHRSAEVLPTEEISPPHGTLRGRIVWGNPAVPGRREVPVGAVAIVASHPDFDESRGLFRDDILVVHPQNRGLKNAFVYLLPGPEASPFDRPPGKTWGPLVVDVTHGALQPRAIAVRAGQAIVLTNRSAHGQNLRWLGDGTTNPDGMADVPAGGSFRIAGLRPQKLPLTLESTRFGWIKGRVGVFDHPFFAITGDDGAFELRDLPPGRHRLMIYHEDLGYRLGARGKQGEEITVHGGITNLGDLLTGP